MTEQGRKHQSRGEINLNVDVKFERFGSIQSREMVLFWQDLFRIARKANFIV